MSAWRAFGAPGMRGTIASAFACNSVGFATAGEPKIAPPNEVAAIPILDNAVLTSNANASFQRRRPEVNSGRSWRGQPADRLPNQLRYSNVQEHGLHAPAIGADVIDTHVQM